MRCQGRCSCPGVSITSRHPAVARRHFSLFVILKTFHFKRPARRRPQARMSALRSLTERCSAHLITSRGLKQSAGLTGAFARVVGGALAYATPATTASPAGAYAITPSGQASANYALTYVNGTLTVSGASPAVVTSAMFAPQLAAMQRVAVSETRWQPAACRCVAGTAQGISIDAVVASSSRNCESALNDDIFDVATPGVCFFVSSNY